MSPDDGVVAFGLDPESAAAFVHRAERLVADVLGSAVGHAHHVGIVVGDIADAAASMVTAGVGLGPIERGTYELRSQRDTFTVDLQHTMSVDGPVHVELLAGPAGSTWAAAAGAQLHHVAFVVADLRGSSAAMAAAGVPLELTQAHPDGPRTFSYHRATTDRVELLDAVRAQQIRRRLIHQGDTS